MAKAFGRNQALYFTLVGIVVGLLLAGLVVPLGFGTRRGDDFVAFDEAPRDASGATATAPVVGEQDPDPGEGVGPEAGTGPTGVPGMAPTGPGEPRPEGSVGSARPGGQETVAPTGTTGGGAQTPPPAGPLRATDRGVTADAIRLGILLFDLGGISAIGFGVPGADPEEQREAWDAWVDELNNRGGIHGRRVEPSYHQYDVLSEDDMRAACLRATQDDEVFAALDVAALHETALCFTQENRTPLITQGPVGFTQRHYQRSGGLLFSILPEGRRGLANFTWELHQLGELRQRDALGQQENKVVGILSVDTPGGRQAIEGGVVATLDELGYELGHWAELSSDPSVANAQIPGAVNQMRANDVSAVMLLISVLQAAQFVQHAEAQRYDPDYYATDYAGQSSQAGANNMPPGFEGMLITASRVGELEAGFPPAPLAGECADIYRERVGRDDSGDQEIRQWVRRITCQTFRLFEWGAMAAGPELTRESFSQGMQSLGDVSLAVHGGGALSPGKFDIADLVRTAAYDGGCRCWLPVDDFRRARW